MISFPNAKINLGLNILSKREDGYHNLETIFYPIFIKDILEVVQRNTDCSMSEIKSSELNIEFTCTGLPIKIPQQNNLCIKAYYLLKKDFPSLPSIKIHLHKNIPIGAGLGGGSADAAFTLKILNNKFHLNLSYQQLLKYALKLGSDCPFFIINQPCFASSRGEVMEEISVNLSAYKFVIVNPNIHISTAWAFSKILPQKPNISVKEIIKQPLSDWKKYLKNDFEKIVMQQYSAIYKVKEKLYNAGAAYVSMSGSGSTVFGIFEKTMNPELKFPTNYYVEIL